MLSRTGILFQATVLFNESRVCILDQFDCFWHMSKDNKIKQINKDEKMSGCGMYYEAKRVS